ncbi:Hint domain-containing protein [Algicella marina]|uniref:Hint domain-containing protein n=1 Tax=Algicella marina TaxID=2683284 RepID=A0A6P1SUY6_9RHOB|nr:Hint domain-containing protein [Algicella marina]QHQ34504.1 hypothetical protein GO499_04525 [Algicella marina]
MADITLTTGDDTFTSATSGSGGVGAGDDTIQALAGNDTVNEVGANGDDIIAMGDGDDTLNVSGTPFGANEEFYLGAGADDYNMADGAGNAFIDAGLDSDVDTLELGGFASSGSQIVSIEPGRENDIITGFKAGGGGGQDGFYIGDADIADYAVVKNAQNSFTISYTDPSTSDVTTWSLTTIDDFSNAFTPADILATFQDSSTFTPDAAPCLAAGTLVETADGLVAVEDLVAGDLVVTKDRGLQPVRYIAMRTVPAIGVTAPVVIATGALGNTRDLIVSPNHRMAVSGARVEALFGEREMLVAAEDLIDGDRIYRKVGGEITYVHVAFDNHEIIFAEGAATESLQPLAADAALFGGKAYEELVAIFPELANGDRAMQMARPVLRPAEAALLN